MDIQIVFQTHSPSQAIRSLSVCLFGFNSITNFTFRLHRNSREYIAKQLTHLTKEHSIKDFESLKLLQFCSGHFFNPKCTGILVTLNIRGRGGQICPDP